MYSSRSRFSRRSFLATGLTIAVMSHPVSSLSANQQDRSLFTATPDELLDTILTAPERDAAIDALVEVFARSGIAVSDDAVTAPLTTVEDPVSPLSFQRWQLNVMVEELVSGNVRPAAEFDTLAPATTEDGSEVLSVGEMLAGYYATSTPGATFAQAYLNRIIPENLRLTAAELPIPTVLASLLGGEMLGQMYASLEPLAVQTSPFGLSSGPSHGLLLRSAQLPTLELPTLPSLPAIPNIEIAPLPPIQGSTACGMAQSFLSIVQQRIYSVLDAAKSAVSGIPIIGDIVDAVIDGVKIGLGVISKAVDTLLAPVTAVIKTIGAALAVASMVVGTISPWSVAIGLVPAQNRFGVGSEVVTGQIDVTAGGWDRIDFPPVIQECASLAGLQLPEPTSKDSPTTVSVRQDNPLITLDATDLRLDEAGKASTSYVTGTESPEQAKGTEVYGIAWVKATVEREDLKRLRDDLMNLLFSQLPRIIEGVVRPIIGPVADTFTNDLIALLTVSSRRMLVVIYHEPPAEPTPSTKTDEDEGENCIVGTYIAADPVAILRVAFPGPAQITYSGNIVWTFAADGTLVASYDGFVVTISGGPGAEFIFSFAGSASGVYTAEERVVTITLTDSTVSMNADMIGIEGVVGGGTDGGAVVGTYTCGGSIFFPLAMGVQLELVPQS